MFINTQFKRCLRHCLDTVTTAVAFAYLAYVEPLQRFEEWIFHGLNALAVIHPVLLLLLLHPFNGFFSRKTWVSRYQKGKTSLDLNEARDGEVLESNGISRTLCKQYALHSREITTAAPHHSIFYRPDASPGTQPTVSRH